jgi:hypothetical protein
MGGSVLLSDCDFPSLQSSSDEGAHESKQLEQSKVSTSLSWKAKISKSKDENLKHRSANLAAKDETSGRICPVGMPRRTLASLDSPPVSSTEFLKVQDRKYKKSTLPKRALNVYDKNFPTLKVGGNMEREKEGDLHDEVNWGSISWDSVKKVKQNKSFIMEGKINRTDFPTTFPRRTLLQDNSTNSIFMSDSNFPPLPDSSDDSNEENNVLTNKSQHSAGSFRRKRLERSKEHFSLQEKVSRYPDVIKDINPLLSTLSAAHCTLKVKNMQQENPPLKVIEDKTKIHIDVQIPSNDLITFDKEELTFEKDNKILCSDVESQLIDGPDLNITKQTKVHQINEHVNDSGTVLAKNPLPGIFRGGESMKEIFH